MRGRMLSVDKDYDRGFILIDGGIGKTVDDGFEILREKFPDLYKILNNQFDKRSQRFLLESIKAKVAVKLARTYVSQGKKVVIFHQAMKKAENAEPFKFNDGTKKYLSAMAHADQSKLPPDKRVDVDKVLEQFRKFQKEYPKYANLNLSSIPSPIETFVKELGSQALFYNGGQEFKKARPDAVPSFNDDNKNNHIIIVQQDAGNAGISLHDKTGKYPRVLINIAIPDRPAYAMQIEGRIYRVGNASNAVFARRTAKRRPSNSRI